MVQDKYTCEACQKVFRTQDALDDHNFGKHQIKKPCRESEDDGYRTEADYETWMRL